MKEIIYELWDDSLFFRIVTVLIGLFTSSGMIKFIKWRYKRAQEIRRELRREYREDLLKQLADSRVDNRDLIVKYEELHKLNTQLLEENARLRERIKFL